MLPSLVLVVLVCLLIPFLHLSSRRKGSRGAQQAAHLVPSVPATFPRNYEALEETQQDWGSPRPNARSPRIPLLTFTAVGVTCYVLPCVPRERQP